MADDKNITLADVISHMQGMERRLREDLATKKDIAGLTKRLDKVHLSLQRLYEKRTELTERVRVIEREELPPIKRAVGLA